MQMDCEGECLPRDKAMPRPSSKHLRKYASMPCRYDNPSLMTLYRARLWSLTAAVEQYEGEQAATAASSSSGGGAAVGSSSGMMSGSASLASGFESDEDPNDPNGKRPRRRRRPGAQDGPLGSRYERQTATHHPTTSAPHADSTSLLRVLAPAAPVGRPACPPSASLRPPMTKC